ncbi:hypothetical protein [Paeniglutamicibacter sp. NPDC091659]|uniref:hypothetical protein n=1 Tax=Paeniglutamicibacter sp. NPDC091659 TaxID=3364389 RepID=UPI0037FA281E
MKTYEIAVTVTDVTSVNAKSEEEAYALAGEVFVESGYDFEGTNAQLDIIDIADDDSESV